MEPTIIKASELKENDYGATIVTEILKTKEFDIVKAVKAKDDVKTGYNTKSDIVYYVLDGEGDITVNSKKHHVKKGDCLFYPKGTKYKHSKGLILLAFSIPPFDRKNNFYED